MPDVRCRTCFGGAVPAVSKEPDPLPTAKANGLCLSYSKVFIFSLATSKTVSETLSLWCSRTLKKGCGCVLTSQLCRPPLGLAESLTVPILVPQDSFSSLPKGLEEGVLHMQWWHIPPETRCGCVLHGPLHEQILLEELAWGHRGGPCTRMSLHRSTLSFGVWLGGGAARVFRAQSASQVSVLSSERICKILETHAQSKTSFQRQGLADLQPFRHDEKYLRCRI
jgi:hypothetical protein